MMQKKKSNPWARAKYPEEAKQNKEEGRVVVQFVVDKEGNLTSPTVIRSASKALDEEALRLFSLSPKWIPGKLRGQVVAVKYTVPIMFRLDGNDSSEVPGNVRTINLHSDKGMGNLEVYVDGEKIDMADKSIDDIVDDPAKIASITVDKSKTGEKKAMYITLKKEGEQPAETE